MVTHFLGQYPINGQTGENGQTSVYLGNNANDVSFTWSNSTVTPF